MIQIALMLWVAGLQLLLQVGNCSTDLCEQAKTVAHQAITFAQDIQSREISPIVTQHLENKQASSNSETVDEIAIPTTIKITRITPERIIGGNCSLVTLQTEVDDQFGHIIDVPLYLFDEQNQSTTTIKMDAYKRYMYQYRPQATSTTDKFVFSIGDISLKQSINVGLSWFDLYRDNPAKITQQIGVSYDSLTGKCL